MVFFPSFKFCWVALLNLEGLNTGSPGNKDAQLLMHSIVDGASQGPSGLYSLPLHPGIRSAIFRLRRSQVALDYGAVREYREYVMGVMIEKKSRVAALAGGGCGRWPTPPFYAYLAPSYWLSLLDAPATGSLTNPPLSSLPHPITIEGSRYCLSGMEFLLTCL